MTNSNGATESIQHIVIVGGGTAGWMSAAHLKRSLGDTCRITVIEAPGIPRIGVGEATVPSIQEQVFDHLGMSEEEWMPQCEATYKLGIRYVDWAYAPGTSDKNMYYHLFGEMENINGIPLSHFWLAKKLAGFDKPLSYSCYEAAQVCDAFGSPRTSKDRAVHYAYHMDAQHVANLLQRWSIERGVEHVQDRVIDVRLESNGDISCIVTEKGCLISGDLFIDCSGFRRLLMSALKEPFVSYSDSLLCDSAVTLNVPANPETEGVRPYTTSTALSSGWCWEIPLRTRSGNGYVYSSAFQSSDEAAAEFLRHLGVKDANVGHLKMQIGRCRRSWVKNCVSIGLASGFIEPLESTGIYFIYAALYQLVQNFPRKLIDSTLRENFNKKVAFMVDDVRDFIVMHYCSTHREDTEFWRANRFELNIPDQLQETLNSYRAGVPVHLSYSGNLLYEQFGASFDRFWTNSNYMSVLAGMDVLPARELPLLNHRAQDKSAAELHFAKIAHRGRVLASTLPTHAEYLGLARDENEGLAAVAS